MEWDASLETGNAAVDEQHRELVGLFNELEDTERDDGPAEVRRALDDLTEYVAVHFEMEEQLMRSLAYPPEAFGEHVREHRDLTARTRELVLAHRTGELDSVAPITELLRDWLCDHIEKLDRRLAERANRASA